MEQKTLDIRPYLAAAIARNDRAYARGRMLYYDRPAECEAEALKSGCKNHRAITSCRAEYELKARQMLGVLCHYDEPEVTPVVAHGWRQLYSAIKSDKAVNVDQYRSEDNDASDLLFVSAYFCSILDKQLPGSLKQLIYELTQSYEQAPADTYVAPADIATGKRLLPSRSTGTAALDDAADQQSGEPFELLAHFMGLGLSDYLYNVKLTAEQKGMCALIADGDDKLIRPLAYFAMLINAIKADRRYLLDTHAEKLIIDARTAQIEAAKSREDAARATDQLNRALATIADLHRQTDALENDKRRLTDALAEHEGDAQELAALRSALYRAEEEPEEPPAPTAVAPPSQRIVCIGGHQRWIVQMRDALPDVKFIPADVTLDYNVLDECDAVWFRADYMSHTQYTPAIDICRTRHIPVYYFSGRGAERCIAEICKTMKGV